MGKVVQLVELSRMRYNMLEFGAEIRKLFNIFGFRVRTQKFRNFSYLILTSHISFDSSRRAE